MTIDKNRMWGSARERKYGQRPLCYNTNFGAYSRTPNTFDIEIKVIVRQIFFFFFKRFMVRGKTRAENDIVTHDYHASRRNATLTRVTRRGQKKRAQFLGRIWTAAPLRP
jgi:hypothetical protein